MPNAQFNQELRSWIDTLPSWKKNLSLDILTHGSCREKGIENALSEFLIDQGLKSAPAATIEEVEAAVLTGPVFATGPAVAPEVVSPALTPLKLKSIHGFKSVSALRDGERIEVGPGLTVIYGANGAGKSSYVRLLNRAFSSRGDNDILQNVFLDTTGEPSCEFCFDVDGVEETVAFPAGKDHQHLQRFSVFDGKSARVHLDQKNELLFVPGGFEFFTSLNEGLDQMKGRLEKMITDRKPTNPVAVAFNRSSITGNLVHGINSGTTEKSIREHATVDPAANETLKQMEHELAKLRASEVATDIKRLNSLTDNLRAFLVTVRNINTSLSENSVAGLIGARTQVHSKEQEARQTGTARFAELGIKYADSQLFKDFLMSAAAFMELRGEEDGCPYCDRPFEERGRELRDAYTTFLTSTAEKELAGARHQLESGLRALEQIHFPPLDASQTLFTQLQRDEDGKQLVKTYVNAINTATNYRDELAAELNGITEVSRPEGFIISEETIITYAKSVQDKIEELKKLDPATEIRKKEEEVALLRDRIKLGEELDKVITYLDQLQWCENAKQLFGQLATNSVTIKQSYFYDKYVTEDYLKIFAEECKKLDAELKVEILQQGAKGKTVRDLKIKGIDPRQVLSEGEQRATALADFLTEIQVAGNCCGLVFDDPVNSLDVDRKRLIANRIMTEVEDRQIIVFTHDLVFVSYLHDALPEETPWCCHHVEKNSGEPGRIWLNNSPVSTRDYRRTGIPSSYYNLAKKAPPEERVHLLEQGFGALRTCYETFVENSLLGGAVQRWDEAIRITNLKNVHLNKETFEKVVEKHHEISRYISGHSHSDKYTAKKPTPEDLIREIEAFNGLKKENGFK